MKTGYSVVLSLGLSGLVILLFIILNMFEGARGIMTTFLLASNLPGAYGQAYIGMFACIFILVLALSRNSIVFRPVVWVVPILNFLYGLLPMTWELRKTFNSAYDWGIGGGHGGWREVSAYTSMGLGTRHISYGVNHNGSHHPNCVCSCDTFAQSCALTVKRE